MTREPETSRLRSENFSESKAKRSTENLERWNAAGRRHPDIDASVEEFAARIEEQVGARATPAQVALVASAVALFAGVLLTKRRLLAGRKQDALLERLPALTGALQRSLRALGVTPNADDAESVGAAPGPDAPLEERQAWSRRYVEAELAKGRA